MKRAFVFPIPLCYLLVVPDESDRLSPRDAHHQPILQPSGLRLHIPTNKNEMDTMLIQSRARLTIGALFAALSLTGCMTSTSPKFHPDPVAKDLIRDGFYEKCEFVANSDGNLPAEGDCETLKISVRPDSIVAIQYPSQPEPKTNVIIHRLRNGTLAVQSTDISTSKQEYYFAYLYPDPKVSNGFKVLSPSCEFNQNILDGLASDVGISMTGGGPKCNLTNLTLTQSDGLLTFLSKRRDWKIDDVLTYVLLDPKVGERRFALERQAKGKK